MYVRQRWRFSHWRTGLDSIGEVRDPRVDAGGLARLHNVAIPERCGASARTHDRADAGGSIQARAAYREARCSCLRVLGGEERAEACCVEGRIRAAWSRLGATAKRTRPTREDVDDVPGVVACNRGAPACRSD